MSIALGYPGNISFSGTVSAPLFVSTQQIIAPVAAGTASTLTVGSISSSFGSLVTAFTATLSVGTILNFSAGGSIGTNLALTGTLSASNGSLTTAYTATLSVGTILNFSAGGSIGTNLALTGTLSASNGSLTTAYAATLSIGTILNFLQGQTVTTSGTTAGTFVSGTVTFPGGLSVTGSIASSAVIATSGSFNTVYSPNGSIGSLASSAVIATLGSFNTLYSANGSIGSLASSAVIATSGSFNTVYSATITAANGSFGSLTFGSVLQTSVPLITSPGSYGTPTTGTFGGAGDKIVCYPGSVGTYPYSIGVGVNNDLWHNVPAANGQHTWFIGGSQKACLSNAGYWGINNSAPSYPLDTTGNARITGALNVGSNQAYVGYHPNYPSSVAAFGHTVFSTTSGIGFYQDTSGNCFVNCATGSSGIYFRCNNLALGTSQVQLSTAGILTGLAKQVSWTAITSFGTGVSAYSGYGSPQFCVDELGYVRTRGLLSYSTSYTKGQALFTMPTAGRPVYGGNYILVGLLCNQGTVEVDFLPSGAVNVSAAQPTVSSGTPGFVTSGYISLEGVCFWPGAT